MAVYGEAMGYPPELLRPGAATSAHTPPAGLPGGRHARRRRPTLLGFGYGYASGARPVVARPGARRRCAETPASSGCATASSWSSCTCGRRPRATASARACCTRCSAMAAADRAAVHARGATRTSRAWRLYRRFGFVDVLRHFLFPGDDRPFAVLGRQLPLAERRPRTLRASSASERCSGPWALLGVLVLAQIAYPLTPAAARAALTVATVAARLPAVGRPRVAHPRAAGGGRAGRRARGGGFAVEAVGVATGVPFGTYDYAGRSGPKLLGVPAGDPAGLDVDGVAGVARRGPADRAARRPRVAVAAAGLAAWDLFLDPQMVAEGTGAGTPAAPALPGVPGIPLANYLGWLGGRAAADGRAALAGRPAGRRHRSAGPCRVRAVPVDVRLLASWRTRCSSACRRRRCGAACGMGAVAMPLAAAGRAVRRAVR